MLQSSLPPRQQAHDLVDRINPDHLAVAICMLQTMAQAEQAVPRPAAFNDDIFPERERDAAAAEKLPCQGQGVDPKVLAELGLKSDDTDYWPERRPAPIRHVA
ncbi:MAG: hypothetical protein ACLGSD_03475 [Acidobacteriota bacterium]